MTKEEFLAKARVKHGGKYEYIDLPDSIKTIKDKVKVICPKHGVFEQLSSNHLAGYGCKMCSVEKRRFPKISNEEMIKRFKSVHGDKFIYDKTDVNNKDRDGKVIITCRIHGDFKQDPHNHERGSGCPYCAGKLYDKCDFEKAARLVHGKKYKYDKFVYIDSHTKGIVTCPIHGDFLVMPYNHIHNKSGCPKCKSSKVETEIRKTLSDNNIIFEEQKKFDWLGKQSLDFYLPKYNIAIECQGVQHFKPIDYFGGENGFKLVNERDRLKKSLCEANGVKLLYYTEEEGMFEFLGEQVYSDKNVLIDSFKEN